MRNEGAPLFRTRITELFGIDRPILCGGLMWLADAPYVAAVARAGGLGFLSARSFADPAAFRDQLQTCRDLAGGYPFGVNLYLSRRPDENRFLDSHIDILLSEGVRCVETAGVPPGPLVSRLKRAGCMVIHKVSAVRHALSAERLGVDAIAIVGAECGGHPGLQMIGTMVQAARAAQELTVPWAVGGGIGHGSQLVAALAMGADAVLLGSRMNVAEEIWAHPSYKQRLVEATEADTRVILTRFRSTYRALDNEEARAVAALEADGVGDFEAYRPHVAGRRQREAYESGDWNRGILSMGQAVAFATAIEPVQVFLDRIMAEAGEALRRLDTVAGSGSRSASTG